MEDDDRPVGRVLTRREALGLMGAAGVSILAGCAPSAPSAAQGSGAMSCVVRPEQTEGPYFVDTRLDRSDIRPEPGDGSVKAGLPLALVLNLSRVTAAGCTPLQGALVDVWQCDALGVYSGVRDTAGGFATQEQKFLRGYQVTDASGSVRFTTIYPGWYPGRTVHIHFKVRTDPAAPRGSEFTSQLYFPDSLTDQVLAAPPYSAKGARTVRNEQDGIFRRSGGEQLMLRPTREGNGYLAAFGMGLEAA